MELSNYRASEIPEIIAKAFFIARSGRPGPVLVYYNAQK
jgi:thiamine pyrophosphate-dependent acetolactate synthase large subunit-like protein